MTDAKFNAELYEASGCIAHFNSKVTHLIATLRLKDAEMCTVSERLSNKEFVTEEQTDQLKKVTVDIDEVYYTASVISSVV